MEALFVLFLFSGLGFGEGDENKLFLLGVRFFPFINVAHANSVNVVSTDLPIFKHRSNGRPLCSETGRQGGQMVAGYSSVYLLLACWMWVCTVGLLAYEGGVCLFRGSLVVYVFTSSWTGVEEKQTIPFFYSWLCMCS